MSRVDCKASSVDEVLEATKKALEIDGVAIFDNCLSAQAVGALRTAFDEIWSSVESDLKDCSWRRATYANGIGKVCPPNDMFWLNCELYENIQITNLASDGTVVLDLGHGRFDFYSKMQPLLPHLLSNPLISQLVESLMQSDYHYQVGGLPVTRPSSNYVIEQNGRWHRDLTQLFDEATDTALPPCYYTLLIPLEAVTKDGGATEFILGSHKWNLGEQFNVNSLESLSKWVATLNEVGGEEDDGNGEERSEDISLKLTTPTVEPGSIVIFEGRVVHRATRDLRTGVDMRRMIYCVVAKNWYNDYGTKIVFILCD